MIVKHFQLGPLIFEYYDIFALNSCWFLKIQGLYEHHAKSYPHIFKISSVFTQINVGGITILGTVIIGGMIWITRSDVKFRIWVNSEGHFIENAFGAK